MDTMDKMEKDIANTKLAFSPEIVETYSQQSNWVLHGEKDRTVLKLSRKKDSHRSVVLLHLA